MYILLRSLSRSSVKCYWVGRWSCSPSVSNVTILIIVHVPIGIYIIHPPFPIPPLPLLPCSLPPLPPRPRRHWRFLAGVRSSNAAASVGNMVSARRGGSILLCFLLLLILSGDVDCSLPGIFRVLQNRWIHNHFPAHHSRRDNRGDGCLSGRWLPTCICSCPLWENRKLTLTETGSTCTSEVGRTQHSICPVAAILFFMAARPPHLTGPLFRYHDGTTLTRSHFIQQVKRALSVSESTPPGTVATAFTSGQPQRQTKSGYPTIPSRCWTGGSPQRTPCTCMSGPLAPNWQVSPANYSPPAYLYSMFIRHYHPSQ